MKVQNSLRISTTSSPPTTKEFLMSTYPKYLYIPDWCSDEETPFSKLFYNKDSKELKEATEATQAKLLYLDPDNCNGNPELVFEFQTEESLHKFLKICVNAESKKPIPEEQILILGWNTTEGYYWSTDEEYTDFDILNFIHNNQDTNTVK
jgi:hypothetical protein